MSEPTEYGIAMVCGAPAPVSRADLILATVFADWQEFAGGYGSCPTFHSIDRAGIKCVLRGD